ncbi:MAG: tetratricopeptide repeat protein [Pseudomonadota bacterium]
MNILSRTIRYIPAAFVLCLSAQLLHASPGTDAYANGDFASAEPMLSQELRAEDDVEKRILLGIISMSRNDFDEAYTRFSEAAERYPNNADAQYWVGASSGSLAGNASIFKASGHAKRARKAFQRAIELDPEHIEAHQGLIQYYLQAPGFLGGDKDEALTLAKSTVDFAPIEGRLLVAQVYGQTKQPQKRDEVLAALLKAAPNDPRAYVQLGFQAQNDEQFDAAHDYFSRAAETTSDIENAAETRQSARYQVGRTAVFSEQRAEAGITALTDYLEGDITPALPGKDWATFRRGQLHALTGDEDAARSDFESARAMTEDERLIKEVKRALK